MFDLQLLSVDSDAAPWRNSKSAKSSVFSLFNLKAKSKFWSESVIRTGAIFFLKKVIFLEKD